MYLTKIQNKNYLVRLEKIQKYNKFNFEAIYFTMLHLQCTESKSHFHTNNCDTEVLIVAFYKVANQIKKGILREIKNIKIKTFQLFFLTIKLV